MKPSTEKKQKILSNKEAAEYLGISLHSLKQLRRTKDIPCHFIFSRPMFAKSDLDEFLKKNKQNATEHKQISLPVEQMNLATVAKTPILSQLQLLLAIQSDGRDKAMIERWIAEYTSVYRTKYQFQKVLNAITEGYDTLVEISAQTKISYSSVRRLVSQLLEQGKIIERVHKNSELLGASEKSYQIP